MIRLADDRRRCQWVTGDTRSPDARQCASLADAPKPYCRAHTLIAYRQAEAARPAPTEYVIDLSDAQTATPAQTALPDPWS